MLLYSGIWVTPRLCESFGWFHLVGFDWSAIMEIKWCIYLHFTGKHPACPRLGSGTAKAGSFRYSLRRKFPSCLPHTVILQKSLAWQHFAHLALRNSLDSPETQKLSAHIVRRMNFGSWPPVPRPSSESVPQPTAETTWSGRIRQPLAMGTQQCSWKHWNTCSNFPQCEVPDSHRSAPLSFIHPFIGSSVLLSHSSSCIFVSFCSSLVTLSLLQQSCRAYIAYRAPNPYVRTNASMWQYLGRLASRYNTIEIIIHCSQLTQHYIRMNASKHP